MLYGDDKFDTFAAQLASPMFHGLCESDVLVPVAATFVADAIIAASAVVPIPSPVSSNASEVMPLNINRRYRCTPRVIFSSSSPGESRESAVDKSVWDDACRICGESDGEMLCCEGVEGCSTVAHQHCLG
jgi:hypothetical protein